MPTPRLHLDADTSNKALFVALTVRGHDVTRTPAAWIAEDADDELQLRSATAQQRIIFTFNVRDFIGLAQQYPDHAGILFAAQDSWTLSQLIMALDRMLREPTHKVGWAACAGSMTGAARTRAAGSSGDCSRA